MGAAWRRLARAADVGLLLQKRVVVELSNALPVLVGSSTARLAGWLRQLDLQHPSNGRMDKGPPLRIVHVASEMAPIAKAGGLGDVVTALGRAVQVGAARAGWAGDRRCAGGCMGEGMATALGRVV